MSQDPGPGFSPAAAWPGQNGAKWERRRRPAAISNLVAPNAKKTHHVNDGSLFLWVFTGAPVCLSSCLFRRPFAFLHTRLPSPNLMGTLLFAPVPEVRTTGQSINTVAGFRTRPVKTSVIWSLFPLITSFFCWCQLLDRYPKDKLTWVYRPILGPDHGRW